MTSSRDSDDAFEQAALDFFRRTDKQPVGPFSRKDYIAKISHLLQVDDSSSLSDSSAAFWRHTIAPQLRDNKITEKLAIAPLSDLALSALDKLDGVYAVQVFFQTWPYYARRANSRTGDPLAHFDAVISEHPPVVKLPPDMDALFQVYTAQMWAMSLVYIESILEGYLLDLFEHLKLKPKRMYRNAAKLMTDLIRLHHAKDGSAIEIDLELQYQLEELTATRHLWAHKNGVVDETYRDKDASQWWASRPPDWPEPKPELNQIRPLSEWYIKSNIYFAKRLIELIDPQVL